MAPEIHLLVNGSRYFGWKSARITQSIEAIADSFDITVVDHWPGREEGWTIQEEDECEVVVDGVSMLKGWIDVRSPSFSGQGRSLSYSGRSKSSVMVDCSIIPAGWTFRNETLGSMVAKIAEQFGVEVLADDGLADLAVPRKISVAPGERAFELINRLARDAGVLVVAEGDALRITRSGTQRSTESLIEGENIINGNATYDHTQRYRQYILVSMPHGSDNNNGQALRVKAIGNDDGVTREERALLLRPKKGITLDFAQQRVDWEARIRAAKSEKASVTVHRWQRRDGTLWETNELVYVKSPTLGIDGQMLISELSFTLDQQGEMTQIELVRPDAFEPEPTEPIKSPSSGRRAGGWKELAGGV